MSEKEVKKKSILFVYTGFSSFVKNDYNTLASVHAVKKYHYAPVRGIVRNALEIIKQFFFLLLYGWKFDLIFCWFADYHSFLPVLFAKIFRKKSIIVIGGYDVCRIRKLNYGAFCSPFRGWFCAKSMRLATCILPVSYYVDRKAGVIAPLTKRKMIYNCVTLESAKGSAMLKTDTILTVGLINNDRTFYLKGIDTFIETARQLPGFKFQIVGINQTKLAHKLGNLPINMTLYDKVDHEELIDFYKNAKVYCQLSRSESFGVSILEAMTFGEFPVVTREGGMPEVVGDFGTVVERDPKLIAELIEHRILKDGIPNAAAIEMHIEKLFTKKLRADSLLQIIDTA
jgi:glycosyltransferase involved in cell wall biosynthesis